MSQSFRLAGWVALAMIVPAVVAVLLLGRDALSVIARVNEVALERERAAVERGLKVLGDLHAAEMMSQAVRDDAFRNVVLAKRPDWMVETFGSQAMKAQGGLHILVVAPHNTVIYSSDVHGEPPADSVAGVLSATASPMERARTLYQTARAVGVGLGGAHPATESDGIYVSDMIRVDGRPALVTVAPFGPANDTLDLPKEPTLLVGVQFMTPALLGKLGAIAHVSGLDHASPAEASSSGAPLHVVRDAKGNAVTHLTWDFAAPGNAILKAALPAIAVSLGLVGLLTTLAAVLIHRMMHRLVEGEQAALYASRHDTATGLANRGWFMRVFADIVSSRDGTRATRAVLLIDCDHFKSINDTLGHAAGDAVLGAVAERLEDITPEIAIAARLGGDEFACVTAPLASPDDAPALLAKIEKALTASVTFEGYVIEVSVSIGAAVLQAPSTASIDAWLGRADLALYRAKRDGRGCARLYDPEMDNGNMPARPARPANTPSVRAPRAA
ncbi:MAG: diguanylate cyclase [Hyphomicrobium sp.]|uniref:diguanylate cyclase domain-containing protein n=1 Tax=Hyphomicrobium sp. TaxID=82 RepID=UPI003D14B96A